MESKLRLQLKDDYYTYSPTNRLVVDNILNQEGEFNLTIKELSKISFCSPSNVIKFYNSLGYKSYKVFCHELNNNDYDYHENIFSSFNLVDWIVNCLVDKLFYLNCQPVFDWTFIT